MSITAALLQSVYVKGLGVRVAKPPWTLPYSLDTTTWDSLLDMEGVSAENISRRASDMAPLSQASAAALSRLRAYVSPSTAWSSVPLSRRAAVLILLFADRKGDLRVVITMRSSTLKSYSGQAALPGGKSDFEAETPFDTARREAFEEIGLPTIDSKIPPPFRVEHICELPTNLAKTELVVRPCLAFLHSRDDASGEQADVEEKMIPRLDAREVAAVFSAPFHNFLSSTDEIREGDPPLPTGKPTDWYRGQWTDWHQSKWRMHNFFVPITNQRVTHPRSKDQGQVEVSDHLKKREAEGSLTRYRVFGMTARILVDAARIAYGQEPEFEHNSHLGDEDMIRRLMKIGRLSDLRKPGDELTKEVLAQAAKI